MITFSNLGNMGRLGNQLFQIAAVIGYARKYNQRIEFPKWSYEKCFNFEYELLQSPVHTKLNESDILNFNELPGYFPQMGNVDLNGYFQSDKYFYNSKKEILNTFKTKETKLNSGFIHLRFGDYVSKQQYHPLQSKEYYLKGMGELNLDHYYCFSDDIEKCKEMFQNDSRIEFVENTNEIQDLELMMQCKGSVIANSSFSWWGAFLGNHNNVIIPKNWFGPAYNWFRIEDRLCENWKSI